MGRGEGLEKSNISVVRYPLSLRCYMHASKLAREPFEIDVISIKISEKRLVGQKQGAKEHEI